MRSNKAHRLLALLLAFVMTFSLLPTVTAWAAGKNAANATSGKAGDNITWVYDAAAKTIMFSGTGPMYDYEDEYPAWADDEEPFIDNVETLIVGEGITSIARIA